MVMDEREDIRKTKIADLVNNAVSSSVRLKNAISTAKQNNKLPFQTIGDYIDAGPSATELLLNIENLGRKTANELHCLIESAATYLSLSPTPEIDLGNLGQARECKTEIREIRLVDLVNNYSGSSRLRNSIATASVRNTLPFETIGDYLDAGTSARKALFGIKNIGRKTVKELIHMIETIAATDVTGVTKYQKRNDLIESVSKKYPGVFEPLIEEYRKTSADNVLRLEEIEEMLEALTERKSKDAEMVWFRFAGETLDAIGKSFGITRERVRQITSKYLKYTADPMSPMWAEKAVRHLIEKNGIANSVSGRLKPAT